MSINIDPNLRNPSTTQTPRFEDAVSAIVDSYLVDLHTCLPGIVLSYDSDRQVANVQPSIKRGYYTQDAEVILKNLPVLIDVPVVFPRTMNSYIHLPVSSGDLVLLMFSERSLDAWKQTGKVESPQSYRKFSLSDAFALVGGYSTNHAVDIENKNSIEVKNKESLCRFNDDGTLSFKNNQYELIRVLNDLVDSLINSRVATSLGPQPLIDPSDPSFVMLKNKIESFLES